MKKGFAFQSVGITYPKKLFATDLWLRGERLYPFFLHKATEDLETLKEVFERDDG